VSSAYDEVDDTRTHTATWNWGDGTECRTSPPSDGCMLDELTNTVTGNHSYNEAGIYTVILTVRNSDAYWAESIHRFVVVYDPTGGFVTGGGWINSPPEACPSFCGEATGKADFGFVSKYKRGAHAPVGGTEFEFEAGDLYFQSDSYEWLVVAGHRAQFKGVGTINGVGNYGFMISAIDEKLTPSTDVDLFRIKIWDKDLGDSVVYDNEMGAGDDADPTTAIGGGSIVVHKPKK
jgi:PKD repeat protein